LYSVRLYQSTDFNTWNQFVANAKNATFLFHRNFMEYHKDRFEDFSLMVFKGNKLMALLPANRIDNEVFSHQGLTYGGFLLSNNIKLKEITEGFKAILEYLKLKKISTFHLKLIPSFYTSFPSEEIQQLLYILQAKLIKRELFSVIKLTATYKIQGNRIEGVKKAKRNNLIIKEVEHLNDFWNTILAPNLWNRYQTKPTHSLEEIRYLKNQFPENIRQFNVYKDNTLIGGTTVFETPQVVHIQYISGDNNKQAYGTLDFLFHELLTKTFKHKHFFDFGSSSIPNTNQINSSLYYWKECFGAKGYTQDFFSIDPNKYYYLDDFLN